MKHDLDTMRHSAAHLLAAAVKNLYPKTALGIGPVIEDGFYYDFDSPHNFSTDDFQKMEREVTRLKKQNIRFERSDRPINEAVILTKKFHEPYKVELIKDLAKTGVPTVSFYKTGGFIDLCSGPHVEHSGQVGEVKLLTVAGAYWKGSEQNKMLQRVYGTAWYSKKELQEYMNRREEIKKRDHKALGTRLELFFFHETAPGMPYWLPNGAKIYKALIDFSDRLHKEAGYEEIISPILNKRELYVTSGHWKYYLENMFVAKTADKETYGVKAMNCPNAMLIFSSKTRSYRDLPLRLYDTDPLHRNERSGTLTGLFRVRQFRQDDAHIFTRQEDLQRELAELLKLIEKFYSTFRLEYSFRLGTKPAKSMGSTQLWKKAEGELKKALDASGARYSILEGDGAFYGPKADLLIKDSLGRQWQMGTIQIDFQTPRNFKLKFTSQDGKDTPPVVIHRAIYGSFERFIGILIEHFGGNFPLWLAPIQVTIVPIADRHSNYAKKVVESLVAENIRSGLDDRSVTMQSKIRDAEMKKVPYVLIIGDKETVRKKVTVRSKGIKNEGAVDLDNFTRKIKQEIEERR
ncbi:MAG: threonine--tRNA ligase [Candidatus Woykebacteria bacterium]